MAGSDRAFEAEFGRLRHVGTGAVAPEPESGLAHDGGDLRGVEHAGIGRWVGEVEADIVRHRGNARQRHVGQRLVPALLFVDLGAQAQRARHRIGAVSRAVGIGPQHHQLAIAEGAAIGHRLGNIGGEGHPVAAARGDIGEPAQSRGGGGDLCRDGRGIEPRRAEDARLDAGHGFGREQRLQAGVGIAVGRPDHIGIGFGLVGAFLHPHHDDDRARLVADRLERALQRAAVAGLARRDIDIARDQHRRVEREGGVEIGLGLRAAAGGGGGDQADHCQADLRQAARPGGGFGDGQAVGHGLFPFWPTASLLEAVFLPYRFAA